MKNSSLKILGAAGAVCLGFSLISKTFKNIVKLAGFAAVILCSASLIQKKLKNI